MPEEPTDMTQRILQDVQQRLIAMDKKMDQGFLNLNVRMTSLESKIDAMGLAQTGQSERLDEFERRLQIVERRLEISDS